MATDQDAQAHSDPPLQQNQNQPQQQNPFAERQAERDALVAGWSNLRKGLPIESASVLAALAKVPRHVFVPEVLQPQAYDDVPQVIGHQQTISQPYIVALMSQMLDLKPTDRVLEIGTGSGYQAAVLAELAAEVFSIEIIPWLAACAAHTLASIHYKPPKLQTRCGDGFLGWPEAAPFDAIILTAAPEHIPQPLLDQLGVGGRLVVPVGDQTYGQQLQRITRDADGILHQELGLPVLFVPMTGLAQESE